MEDSRRAKDTESRMKEETEIICASPEGIWFIQIEPMDMTSKDVCLSSVSKQWTDKTGRNGLPQLLQRVRYNVITYASMTQPLQLHIHTNISKKMKFSC